MPFRIQLFIAMHLQATQIHFHSSAPSHQPLSSPNPTPEVSDSYSTCPISLHNRTLTRTDLAPPPSQLAQGLNIPGEETARFHVSVNFMTASARPARPPPASARMHPPTPAHARCEYSVIAI